MKQTACSFSMASLPLPAVMLWIFLNVLGMNSVWAAQKPVEVYRCGSSKNHYSQWPCHEGQRLEIQASRSEEQTADAHALARGEDIRAYALEHERLKQEALSRSRKGERLAAPILNSR